MKSEKDILKKTVKIDKKQMECTAYNGRFCEMAEVTPQKRQCELGSESPSGTLVNPTPRKTARTLCVAIGVASLLLEMCTPVKELSDAAQISGVTVEGVKPSAVLLGDPRIEDDYVTIPLVFGKYLFPIEIEVNVRAAQEIDKILGLNLNKSVVFESLQDIHRVDLIALSGVVKSYVFRLEEVPSNDDANIEQFEILTWDPESFLLVQMPKYDLINRNIELFGISDHFPLILFPQVTISEGARLSMDNSSFAFTSYNTQIPLSVTAESGKESQWHLKLSKVQIIPPAQAPNVEVRERLSIRAQSVAVAFFQIEQEPQVMSIEVDEEESVVKIIVKTDDWNALNKATLSFPIHPYSQIVGYLPGELFSIQRQGVQKIFYIVDMLDGYAAEWKIEMVQWLSSAAEIEKFEVERYHSEFDIIELGAPILSPHFATVEIPVVKGYGFPVVVDAYQWEISTDAHVIDPLPNKLIFTDFTTQYLTKIEAQNGEIVQWTLSLIDAREGSGDAKVLGYSILSYSGSSQTENNLVLSQQASINTQNQTITLHILDWGNKFPLRVHGQLAITPGALLLPFSFSANHELLFNSLQDVYTFTIISENGETELSWSLVLQDDSPPKSNAKEVVDFITGAPSSGFQFAEKYIEPFKRQITLIVQERPSSSASSLILAPRISISPNARLIDIVSGAQLSLSFDQPKRFYVQAQDESREEWSIALVYAPQIPNSDFESWGRANNSDLNLLPSNGTGWCTANSSTMSNTSRVAGHNSPYAVSMQTVLQTMNFVIFKVTTLASATAFLGSFTLRTGVNDVYNPISMTRMGIPFVGDRLPVAFSIDYKYIRGGQMVYTEPNWGSIIPSFKNPVSLSEIDAANIRVELFHNPTGLFDYIRSRYDAIARGDIFLNTNAPEWTTLQVPIEVMPGKEGLTPTHIVVVLTSSHLGDFFKGAAGSILTADNFRLIYYLPEEGYAQME